MADFSSSTDLRRSFCLLLLICAFAISATGRAAAAENNQDRSPELLPAKSRRHHHHCGLYCLYAAMKLAGKNVQFRELVKTEYLGSREGSSLAELRKASEDHGLYAKSVAGLTTRALAASPYPVILHVKPTTADKDYDHFELFLCAENGQAKLFDPPEPVRLVPFHRLASRWDGRGLIVSAEPISLWTFFKPDRIRLCMYIVAGVVIIFTIRRCRRWWPSDFAKRQWYKLFGLSVAQGVGFAVLASLCGMFYHFADDEGFLANNDAATSIRQAHMGNFIPKLSENAARKLLNTDTVFIDARRIGDFEAGHLSGAISLPANANDSERQRATANIAKDSRIVVYCQSTGCGFAEKMAIQLRQDGFFNVSIFQGGWDKWKSKDQTS
jgi:rhodanese-related sulfurtransferase